MSDFNVKNILLRLHAPFSSRLTRYSTAYKESFVGIWKDEKLLNLLFDVGTNQKSYHSLLDEDSKNVRVEDLTDVTNGNKYKRVKR